MLQLPPLGPLHLLLNIRKAGRLKTNVGSWQNEAASYKTNQTNQAKQIKLMLFVDKMGPLVNSPEMPQPVDRRLKPIDTSIGVELSWWWWWWWLWWLWLEEKEGKYWLSKLRFIIITRLSPSMSGWFSFYGNTSHISLLWPTDRHTFYLPTSQTSIIIVGAVMLRIDTNMEI